MPDDQHDETLELLDALVDEVPAEQKPELREQRALIPLLLDVDDADAAEKLVIALLNDARQRHSS